MAELSVKRVLMIAYHYPPSLGSSGLQRTLKFSRYLQHFGWEPIVLTVNPRAHAELSWSQVEEVPSDIAVRRTLCLDAARHLSVMGKYPKFFALPDRWANWSLSAIPVGLHLIRRYKPLALWSTYPIATAHLIGLALHKLTSLPWMADFRDSMTEAHYPADATQRRVYRWIEKRAVRSSSRSIFTAPGALRMYAERYPEIDESRFSLIYNGYDDENFTELDTRAATDRSGPIKLVHSGVLYPNERNPLPFFDSVASLKAAGKLSGDSLGVVLRATGHDDYYEPILKDKNIDDIVHLAPPLAYEDALTEMTEADGLLLFQSKGCNHQIPAKLFEYLRAWRPILALTHEQGDTAAILRDCGFDSIVDIDNAQEIAPGLQKFVDEVSAGSVYTAPDAKIERFSRRGQTGELARLLDRITTQPVDHG